jgi:hypothetical protein
MTRSACVSRVVKASAGTMSEADAKKAINDIFDHAEQLKEKGLAAGNPIAIAAQQLADKERAVARADRIRSLQDHNLRKAIINDIKASGGLPRAITTIRGYLHGLIGGRRQGAESLWHGMTDAVQGALDNRLRVAGLKKAAQSGVLDREIAREWWNINAGKHAGAGVAADIAKFYSDSMNYMRDRLNGVGAMIGKADDYVTRTTHDADKIRRAAGPRRSVSEAFSAWWDKTRPRLDDKTFADLIVRDGETQEQAEERFGRSVFDSLISGIHLVVGGLEKESDYIPPAFEGSRNLAKSLSHERTLFWKDADSWLDHMQEFGTFHNLHSSVMGAIDRGARQFGLMKTFGRNPAANLNMIIRKLEEEYRTSDDLKKFQSGVQGLRNVMGRLDGSLNIPVNMGLAKFLGGVRTVESTASLGGVGLTHFASVWSTVPSELAHHGFGGVGGRLQSLANMIGYLTRRDLGSGALRDILSDMGAFTDGINRHMSATLGDDSIPGRISSIASRFMDMTGVHYIFDRTKAGVRSMVGHNLGRNIGKSFTDLDPHIQRILDQYGVDSTQWSLLQKASAHLPVAEGRAYLTPSVASHIPDTDIEAHLLSSGKIGPAPTEQSIRSKAQSISDAKDVANKEFESKRSAHQLTTEFIDAEKARLAAGASRSAETRYKLSYDKALSSNDPNSNSILTRYEAARDKAKIDRDRADILTQTERGTATGKALELAKVRLTSATFAHSAAQKSIEPANIQKAIADHAAQLQRMVAGVKDDISDRLRSYYSDTAAHAVVQAGVRERALLLGSTRPGTVSGEIMRSLAQFKMWPLAAMHQILGREIFTSLSKGEAAFNLGMLLALGIPAGYIRMAGNDLATGKPLRNPVDPATLLAAAAQSGGLGILGDFAFGETSRMGGGLVATLGGPIASDADTLISMYNKTRADAEDAYGGRTKRNGVFGDLWPDLAHFGVRHVPFANLVYLKGSLDYLLWYHLYEAASPGWWQRTNRRLLHEQGRTMQGFSPGAGVPYGIPGLYLSHGPGSGLLGPSSR